MSIFHGHVFVYYSILHYIRMVSDLFNLSEPPLIWIHNGYNIYALPLKSLILNVLTVQY